jgi:hypothetical protein
MRRNLSELILLRCSNCGNDLDGLSSDVIFYCSECGLCWLSGEKLTQVKIEFVRPGGPGSVFLPFWKVDTSITIRNRLSRKGSSVSVFEGFRELSGRERGLVDSGSESKRDRFIFPAFSTSLVLSTGVRMHAENFLPARIDHGTRFKVIGGSVGREDAVTLAKAVAVGVEVNRSDYLASIDLDVEVHSTDIYAIGCEPYKHVVRINDSEIGIPQSALSDFDKIFPGSRPDSDDRTS